jgi:hypothetical protein
MDGESRWTATADSQVVLNGNLLLEQVDALPGVTITAKGAAPAELELPSGGKLVVTL